MFTALAILGALLSIGGPLMNYLLGQDTNATNKQIQDETNATNKQIADETNATNLQIAQETNQSNKEIQDAVNAMNLQIAQETNAANLESVKSTNATNKQIADDTNALQRELAETEYQRSTATNQIAELVRAGFSQQQAKMLVAGNFSPATYSAPNMQMAQMQAPLAEMPSPMQAAQMQAAQMQMAHMDAAKMVPPSLGGELGSLGGQLLDYVLQSYSAENGGLVGAVAASPITQKLASHVDEIDPLYLSSPADLRRYAAQNSSPEWLKTLVDSKEFKEMERSLPGQRAYKSWYQDSNNFRSWTQEMELKKYQADGLALDNAIKNIDLTQLKPIEVENGRLEQAERELNLRIATATENDKIEMSHIGLSGAQTDLHTAQDQYDIQHALKELTIKQNMQRMLTQMQLDQNEYEKLKNPEFRQAWLRRVISDETSQNAIAVFMQRSYEGAVETLNDYPEFAHIFDIGQALKTAGITDEDVYKTVQSMLANDEDVSPLLLAAANTASTVVNAVDKVTGTASKIFSAFNKPKKPKVKRSTETSTIDSKGRKFGSSTVTITEEVN